jgi:hypothetical protein
MNDAAQSQTLIIDGEEYDIESLSGEIKELLSLHAQANDMMIGARRQAIIHEVSVTNLASLISQKVTDGESGSDDAESAE